MSYNNIREEELKNKIANDYFSDFDTTKIIGNVDFCVAIKERLGSLFETESLLWAEAKRAKSDVIKSIVQLILTIGKARTFDKQLPPAFLGAFDAFGLAFIPYNDIQEVFYQNDFNWNVTPSNYETKEFKQLYAMVKDTIEKRSLCFEYAKDENELKEFIKNNFVIGKSKLSKTQIDKNNFLVIYNKWLTTVKPTIIINWDVVKTKDIIDGDFYLADLLSSKNQTLKEKLSVLLKSDRYELERKVDDMGMFGSKTVIFSDNQKAHNQFWSKYDRPPKEEYWDYIVERRDLLVPQDVRERKGSFFTPQMWVELSQKYLTDVLGEDWQDEYYIWDCAAGTGSLLAGLTNKYNIWASTLDRQDIDVMRDRIKNGANLLEEHIFQFDFLNDSFEDSKVPKSLQEILCDPEKRKKLVIYINPPYAEATTATTVTNTGANKAGVAKDTITNQKYKSQIGNASNEMFALFFARVYSEISGSMLSSFSTMKYIQGSNFVNFRKYFKAEFKKGFVVPADTFDNVKGKFPIGFLIWDTDKKEVMSKVNCAVFNNIGDQVGIKQFSGDSEVSINKWVVNFYEKKSQEQIGILSTRGNDFQNQKFIHTATSLDNKTHDTKIKLYSTNLIPICVYNAVRHVIEATWLNDRDQFLYPNDGWKADKEFQNDCLVYTLFHGQNRISGKGGVNYWIPFSESEVDSRERFASNFMTQFIRGKLGTPPNPLNKGESIPSDQQVVSPSMRGGRG